ncbi:putative inactive leucine-rich repeat receptor-like protein kinase [Hibiscus syriacus]|uniref:Inactive leucine-rich repeat receptor-like protein kinase n=1 Tax=Hibiscus syriacus TaxID=106335 RepID=A0A6A3AGI6_HIBSY|nr:putative inactive leucine-rich repeat receptor-like protein kinase [Hibiscus syriacus]
MALRNEVDEFKRELLRYKGEMSEWDALKTFLEGLRPGTMLRGEQGNTQRLSEAIAVAGKLTELAGDKKVAMFRPGPCPEIVATVVETGKRCSREILEKALRMAIRRLTAIMKRMEEGEVARIGAVTSVKATKPEKRLGPIKGINAAKQGTRHGTTTSSQVVNPRSRRGEIAGVKAVEHKKGPGAIARDKAVKPKVQSEQVRSQYARIETWSKLRRLRHKGTLKEEVKELSKALTTAESIKKFGVKKNKTSKAKTIAEGSNKRFCDEGQSEDDECCSSSGRESPLNDEPDGGSSEDVCSLDTSSSVKDAKPRVRVEQTRGRRLKMPKVLQNYPRGAESSKVMDEPKIELSKEEDEPRIEETLRLGSIRFISSKVSRSQVHEALPMSKEVVEHVRVENMTSETILREGSKKGLAEDVQVRSNPSKTSGQESKGAKTLRDKATTEKLPNNKWVYRAVTTDKLKSVDFCNAEPTAQVTVVCYEESITQLHIIGNKGTPSLPRSFSMDFFVTTLVKLPDLRVLMLVSLGLWGQFPGKISRLSSLEILNMTSNLLYGTIRNELSSITTLQTLILDENMFTGQLSEWLGSFPILTVLSLRKNLFNGSFPDSFSMLENLRVLALSHNHFQGELPDFSCSTYLQELDLEDNAFGPRLPLLGNKLIHLVLGKNRFRSDSKDSVFLYGRNCLATGNENQHQLAFCRNEALAVGILPQRYISQIMKLGALGLPPYRTLSLEDLEDATNNFDTTAFMGEGSQGQMYRGPLRDGTFLAIRCLKMKKSHSTQSFMHHVELFSKLRCRHLASALGHCFECYLDDSSVSRIFLIVEYIPNGTLRSWISEGHSEQSLTWPQRISSAIRIAKGIQFLHTVIVPGVYSNNLKITDVLMDQNLVEKIGSYNLPLLAESAGKVGHRTSALPKDLSNSSRLNHEDKVDVYDFGVILLEMILGRPSKSRKEVQILKNQLQAVVATDDATRRSISDPAIQTSWARGVEIPGALLQATLLSNLQISVSPAISDDFQDAAELLYIFHLIFYWEKLHQVDL